MNSKFRVLSVSLPVMVISALSGSVSTSYAQNQGIAANRTMMGFAPMVSTSPGNYNFTEYTATVIQQAATSEQFTRNKDDFDYFKSYMLNLTAELNKFQAAQILQGTGIRWMSKEAKLGRATSADAFLTAIMQYDVDQKNLRNQIAGVASIASAFPSVTKMGFDGSGITDIANRGNINFKQLTDNFDRAFAEIEKTLKNLGQLVNTGSGTDFIIEEGSGNGLELKTKIALNFTREKVDGWRAKLEELRNIDGVSRDFIDVYTLKLQEQVQQFIQTWGTEERYRVFNDNDIKARVDELDDLLTKFWTRSYLRTVYGQSLGTMQITEIKKRIGNLEKFLKSTDELATFVSRPAWNDSKYIKLEQNLRIALEIGQDRTVKVLDGSVPKGDIERTIPASMPTGYAGKTPILARANSALTYIGGKRRAAEAISSVLQLILADVIEERMVIRPDGIRKLVPLYKSRYGTTDEDKAKFRALRMAWDAKAAAAAGAENATADPLAQLGGGGNPESFENKYKNVLNVAYGMGQKLTEIETIQHNLDLVNHNDTFDKAIKGRIDNLGDL